MVRLPLVLMIISLAVTGCGGGGAPAPEEPPPANSAPHADAGWDFTQSISPDPIALDGSRSSDLGGAITYSWSVLLQPAGANVSITNPTSVTPTFVAMVPGEYEIQLAVTDTGGKTTTDTVVATLTNDAPVPAITEFNRSPLAGTQVTIDASPSTDPNSHDLTYTWSVLQRPIDSGVPTQLSGPTHSITIDVHGIYVFEVLVTDGFDEATAQVVVEGTIFEAVELSVVVTDAEYNDQSKLIVAVGNTSLSIIERNGDERSVSLPAPATAVSMSPDGLTAAVAHDGQVTHVDLVAGAVLANYPVELEFGAVDIGDIVLDGNGWAFAFSANGYGFSIGVVSINLSTGLISESANPVYGGIKARLHPDGDHIYAADNGISPNDLERYSITPTGAEVDYDSPYHGDHWFCGDLWLAPAGDVALTRCRVLVRTTNDPESDLTFLMQLDGWYDDIRHASFSEFDDRWLIAHEGSEGGGSTFVRAYEVESGNPIVDFGLPFVDDTNTRQWRAQFAFATSESDEYLVLANDDPETPAESALLIKRDPGASIYNLPPRALSPRYAAGRLAETISLDASASYDPEGMPISFNWQLANEPDGSNAIVQGEFSDTLQFTPSVAGLYEFELTVRDDERTSPVARSSVNVAAAGEDLVLRLEEYVFDAEYSEALDLFVYVTWPDRLLHILDMADLSERQIQLTRNGFDVGISQDGLHAAISQAGMTTLVDLDAGVTLDTQEYYADWGDIVLGHDLRAHIIPNRDQWVAFYSIDFTANEWAVETRTVRQNGRLRMHPTEDWVYVADRGLTPDDIHKYDVSAMPPVTLGDSPYHGQYPFSGDVWINEDGDRLLAASTNIFLASADPGIDMTYIEAIPDNIVALSADHSTEIDEWVVVTRPGLHSDRDLEHKMLIYSDSDYQRLDLRDLSPIVSDDQEYPSVGIYVSYAQDESRIVTLLGADGLYDAFAVQISDR